MSRSYKKNKIVKDGGKSGKQVANRKFRKKVKNKLQNHIITEDTILPINKSEVINDYDVCDWKLFLGQKGFWKGCLEYFLKGKQNKLFK